MEITRYDSILCNHIEYMEPHPSGDWVLYDDVEHLLAARDSTKVAEQIEATIKNSLNLALGAVGEGARNSSNAWTEAYAAIQRGITQAARNIAQAIDEYGRIE